MSTMRVCAVAFLVSLSINGYCEDGPEGAKRFGQGGKPSEAQIAEWRAKRAAREAASAPSDATAATGAERHGGMSGMSGMHDMGSMSGMNDGSRKSGRPGGMTAMTGKPEENARGAGRPGGMPMGMRGAGALWLSDTPPMRGDGARGARGGMGGMDMGGSERGGRAIKRLWLRSGNDPQRSGFAQADADSEVETLLVAPFGKAGGEPLPSASDDHKGVSFEMPTQGFYRVYLTSRKLQGDSLSVNVAKMEIANFGHGGDPDEAARAMQATRYLESAPLEIVRERKPDEKKFFQLKSGEDQTFIVLKNGLPLQGARVRFVSHQGWSKEAVSDEQGRVSFQIIRDYFPAWDEFQKRFKATYLVIAEVSASETGKYKDQPYSSVRYQASLPGNYYPSPDDYLSYAWGLGIGLAITLFCGVAVYLYRRRRVKPYVEERLHDGK